MKDKIKKAAIFVFIVVVPLGLTATILFFGVRKLLKMKSKEKADKI